MSFGKFLTSSTEFSMFASSSSIAPEALKTSNSDITQINDAAIGSQNLIYSYEISEDITIQANKALILNLGKIPINGIVLSSSAFSRGIDGLNDSVSIVGLLGQDTSSAADSKETEIIISSLVYSQFITGRFSPIKPYHPITEIFRSFPVNSRYLNLELTNNSSSDITLKSGKFVVSVNFMQADSNNTEADGYPTGGYPIGPSKGFSLLPIPGASQIPTPSKLLPVTDLAVSYNLIPPGASGYNEEYKPTFTWHLPADSITATASEDVDRYMSWILYQLNSSGTWSQIANLSYRPYTSSTPLGLILDPFPFLYVTEIYRIQIEIIAHQEGYPEQTSSQFLTFGTNPYPTPPPPIINPPSVPLNLTGVGGQHLVTLSWDVPTTSGGSLITKYDVQQANDNAGVPGVFSSVVFVTPTPTSTFATVGPLEDETKYFFKVAAINGAGEGVYTSPILVETGPEPGKIPGTVQDMKAIGKLKEIDVSWEQPIYDGGKAITGYRLQRAPDSGGSPGTFANEGPIAMTLSRVVTGLSDNTTYWFRSAAINSIGQGNYNSPVEAKTSAPVTPREPGPPILRSAIPGPAEASLEWEPPADPGTSTITNYKVERAPDSGGSPGTFATVKILNDVKVTDTGLTPNSTYWYRISATNATGYGPVSNTKSVKPTLPASVPSAPVDFKAVGNIKEILTSWKPPVNLGGSAITQYTVGIATSSSGSYTTTTAAAGLLTKVINAIGGGPLSDDTVYFLKISATNSTGTGPFSPIVQAKTSAVVVPPTAPTSLTAQGLVQGMYLSWLSPSQNGGATLQNYELQRTPVPITGPYATIATVSAPQDPTQLVTYFDTSPALPTGANTYSYQVRAKNTINPTPGPFSSAAQGTTVATASVPDAPILKPLSPGITKIDSSWSQGASTGGAALTQFNIQISTTSATSGFSAATGSPVAATVLLLTITGLTQDTTYWVRVNAVNSVGASPWSNVQTTKTTDASGNCDGTCKGSIAEWNGSAGNPGFLPVPNAGAAPLASATTFGSEIFWTVTGLKYGIQKSAGGPGCVINWLLKVYKNGALIATYSHPTLVTIPRNFYILNSSEGPHGKDPNTFVIGALTAETSYTLRCEPQGDSSKSPICGSPPYLSISFTTGKPETPPSTTCETGAIQGSAIEWSGTVSSIAINGTSANPTQIGATVSWSAEKIKYTQCITSWVVQILQTETSTIPLATSPALSTPTNFNVTNYGTSWSSLNPQHCLPGTTYFVKMLPLRNSAGTAPKNLLTQIKTGTDYTPIPTPPIPTGDPNLPQTYITTYGLPSWGKTDMASILSQEYFANGKNAKS